MVEIMIGWPKFMYKHTPPCKSTSQPQKTLIYESGDPMAPIRAQKQLKIPPVQQHFSQHGLE